jgi:hypothetical protein
MRNKTVLLGSSIIERWASEQYIPNSLNLGISGLTSGELMESYSRIGCRHPKNIILYIGSNDITHDHDQDISNEIYQNITEFILKMMNQNQSTNILFVAILKSPNRTKKQIQKIDAINRKMREFSQKHPHLYFCNLNRELSSPKNYLADKTHLSETGYSILSNHILSFL